MKRATKALLGVFGLFLTLSLSQAHASNSTVFGTGNSSTTIAYFCQNGACFDAAGNATTIIVYNDAAPKDLSGTFANDAGTIYNKTTCAGYPTPASFFKDSGVSNFTGLTFDTAWTPADCNTTATQPNTTPNPEPPIINTTPTMPVSNSNPGPAPVSPNSGLSGNSATPSLSPAYDLNDLLQHFYDLTTSNVGGTKLALTFGRYWPAVVRPQPGGTTAIVGWQGDNNVYSKCQVLINGQMVLDGINNPQQQSATVLGLTPSTTYTYDLVYKEAGRQDTDIQQTFTTQAPQ